MYTLEDVHTEEQAIFIKRLYYKFNAKRVVVDGNGIGLILIDYLIKTQYNEVGDPIPPFGIYNDPDKYYKQYITKDTEHGAVYIIKAHAPENTEAYSILQGQLLSNKVRFLINERDAKMRLLNSVKGQKMSPEKRNEYLMPYQLTSILKEEMLNLREEREGVNIILTQVTKGIKKDKFSAFLYGIYYIKLEEENKKRKKKFDAKDWGALFTRS